MIADDLAFVCAGRRGRRGAFNGAHPLPELDQSDLLDGQVRVNGRDDAQWIQIAVTPVEADEDAVGGTRDLADKGPDVDLPDPFP
jgi:hypothetical protein